MSLLDLIKKEDDRYISVNDFIKLIANNTKDTSDVVIEYLGKFCLSDYYNVSVYIKGFGNGYSNEFHLSELIFKDNNADDFRFYTMSELEKDDEFLISYLLKDEVFNIKYIKELNLNYDSLSLAPKPSSQQLIDVQENIVQPTINSGSSETINSVIPIERVCLPKHPKDNTLHKDLGKYQKLLITYDVFTLNQIICLILNYPPDSSSSDHEFVSYLHWIDEEIRSGELMPFNEEQQVEAQQVKVWLARNNYIYKDFNDNIPADPLAQVRQLTEQLTDAQATIKQITNDYEKALAIIEAKEQSTGSFIMGSPTVEQGEPKTNEQIISEFREQITQLTADNNELKKQLSKANMVLADTDAPADVEPLQGIAKYNANKAIYIATGQAVASYIWSMDTTQAIRTGDMVQQVKHVMHSINPNLLPDDKAIREWLSSIAPDYAKKGGKTPKNAPDEISLIMKK